MALSEPEGTNQQGWLEKNFKNQLAWAVFFVSTLGIFFVSYLASGDPGTTKREVFSALVPLFSTWVGTILAFYFAKENFESANSSIKTVFEKLTPDQVLQKTLVSQVMKYRRAIKSITLDEQKRENDITIHELMSFTKNGPTRILIFSASDAISYVIHDSTLTKYVADQATTRADFKVENTSFSEFLAYRIGNEQVRSIVTRMAFVKPDVTVGDARAAMLAVKGAQDVFVTKNGRAEEPVEGWLTNTDITRDI